MVHRGGAIRAGPGVVALCGMGRAGKTSVAAEYVHRQLAQASVVWQFAAEEPAALTAGFGELAAQRARDVPGVGDPVGTGAALVRCEGWLLVSDNVPGPVAVQGKHPAAGRGRALISIHGRVARRARQYELSSSRTSGSA